MESFTLSTTCIDILKARIATLVEELTTYTKPNKTKEILQKDPACSLADGMDISK